MIKVIKNGDHTSPYRISAVADYLSDINELPTTHDVGSTCIVLENKSIWMLSGEKKWIEFTTTTGAVEEAIEELREEMELKADLVDGMVPAEQLPSYVDDVLEFDSVNHFPIEGKKGIIYVDTSTDKTYRWSGSTYIEIGGTTPIGEEPGTAYPGEKGKANADNIEEIKLSISNLSASIVTVEEKIPREASEQNPLITLNELNNYYTKTDIDNTLNDYSTKSEITTILNNYYNKDDIDTTLGDYYTKTAIDTALDDYYTKTEIDNMIPEVEPISAADAEDDWDAIFGEEEI